MTDVEPSDLSLDFNVPAELSALKVRNKDLKSGLAAICIGFGVTGLVLYIRHRITQKNLYELYNQDKQH
jgi:hypothetical protein